MGLFTQYVKNLCQVKRYAVAHGQCFEETKAEFGMDQYAFREIFGAESSDDLAVRSEVRQ